MKGEKLIKQPRCICCGQFYRANPKVRTRQKTCGKKVCQDKRKRMQEKAWRVQDPDYYKNFYQDYIVEYREKHPDYQEAWRAKAKGEIKTEIDRGPSMKSIRLHLRTPLPNFEIKTQFFRLTQSGSGYWVDGMDMQGPRDKNGDRHKDGTSLETFS